MDEIGCWRGGLLIQRVDRQTRMILFQFEKHWQELTANGICLGVVPVDQLHNIRAHPNRHSYPRQASANLSEHGWLYTARKHPLELFNTRYRVFVLPVVVEEFCWMRFGSVIEGRKCTHGTMAPHQDCQQIERTRIFRQLPSPNIGYVNI
jgi:hypothetical protein